MKAERVIEQLMTQADNLEKSSPQDDEQFNAAGGIRTMATVAKDMIQKGQRKEAVNMLYPYFCGTPIE